jgi:HJR/Mrr/RecB family endonuclease
MPPWSVWGRTQGLCSACVQEKTEADERDRKLREESARKLRINASATELSKQEAGRLAKSISRSVDELRSLTPQCFEDAIANMFRRQGYKVEQTPYSNDYGRDAIMWRGGEKFLLECKRYDKDGVSGRPDIQKFHSAIMNDHAQRGFFVTTGGFTKGAIEFATKVPVEIIDSRKLAQIMLVSSSDASAEVSYQSMCRECGDVVRHHLRAPEIVLCRCGNSVAPMQSLDQILRTTSGSVPTCPKCGARMRLVRGRNGKFWGCSDYPKCRSTKPFDSRGRHRTRR